MSDRLVEQAAAVGALVDPARRALYLYVASQPGAVSREQVARAVDLPLHSVKFHLERLLDAGLLDVEFRRLTDRAGPGAGRPSKLYRRSGRQFAVTLPERRYELVGQVLASAVELALRDDVPVADAVNEVARAEGRRLVASLSEADHRAGLAPRTDAGAADVHTDALQRTARVLALQGFEPRTSQALICLRNCPFDRLASTHPALVCGMNLSLVQGVIEELGARGLSPALEPEPGFCCVRVHAERPGP